MNSHQSSAISPSRVSPSREVLNSNSTLSFSSQIVFYDEMWRENQTLTMICITVERSLQDVHDRHGAAEVADGGAVRSVGQAEGEGEGSGSPVIDGQSGMMGSAVEFV